MRGNNDRWVGDTSPHPHVSEPPAPHARYAILTRDEAGADMAALIALPCDRDAAARRADGAKSEGTPFAQLKVVQGRCRRRSSRLQQQAR